MIHSPRSILAVSGLALLTACAAPAPVEVTQPVETAEVVPFARAVLDGLQARSIAESREYCGYIESGPDGTLRATPARPGTEASCHLPNPRPSTIASYHTHGSFSARFNNEIPSSDDLMSDIEAGTDGYISTPAGRLWRVDHKTQLASLLCGPGCVTSDPKNDPSNEGPVGTTYSVLELIWLER